MVEVEVVAERGSCTATRAAGTEPAIMEEKAALMAPYSAMSLTYSRRRRMLLRKPRGPPTPRLQPKSWISPLWTTTS